MSDNPGDVQGSDPDFSVYLIDLQQKRIAQLEEENRQLKREAKWAEHRDRTRNQDMDGLLTFQHFLTTLFARLPYWNPVQMTEETGKLLQVLNGAQTPTPTTTPYRAHQDMGLVGFPEDTNLTNPTNLTANEPS